MLLRLTDDSRGTRWRFRSDAGLLCTLGSFDSGHVMLPSADGYNCASASCSAHLPAPEASDRIAATRSTFTSLHQYEPFGSGAVDTGCLACADAEEVASKILAPDNGMWLLWVTIAMHFAGTARNSKLLMAAIRRREAMAAAETRREDIVLRLQHAIVLGLGSDQATALLRSAFSCVRGSCGGDPAVFIGRWIPLDPPFGARARAAAALALGMRSPVAGNPARAAYALRGGDMFASEHMCSLARARSAPERAAARARAAAAILAWEEERGASLRVDVRHLHEYPKAHWNAEANAAALSSVWCIDDVFSADECNRILHAVCARSTSPVHTPTADSMRAGCSDCRALCVRRYAW